MIIHTDNRLCVTLLMQNVAFEAQATGVGPSRVRLIVNAPMPGTPVAVYRHVARKGMLLYDLAQLFQSEILEASTTGWRGAVAWDANIHEQVSSLPPKHPCCSVQRAVPHFD